MSALVDTSVLVRYLTGDPPHLASQAIGIMDSSEPLLVTEVALVETAYALRTFYAVPQASIVDSLIGLLQKENVSIFGRDKNLIVQALLLCRPSHRVSFGDALIWAAARSGGIQVVYSLDDKFPRVGIEVKDTL
ncbi:MAG: PIN domain-containing protein [Chloroflexi bacterium]|nr:PIN domain-containing protein [Chloroflexota bacterium]